MAFVPRSDRKGQGYQRRALKVVFRKKGIGVKSTEVEEKLGMGIPPLGPFLARDCFRWALLTNKAVRGSLVRKNLSEGNLNSKRRKFDWSYSVREVIIGAQAILNLDYGYEAGLAFFLGGLIFNEAFPVVLYHERFAFTSLLEEYRRNRVRCI